MICMQADWDPHLLLTSLPGHTGPAQRSAGTLAPTVNTDTRAISRRESEMIVTRMCHQALVSVTREQNSNHTECIRALSARDQRGRGSRARADRANQRGFAFKTNLCYLLRETWFTRGLSRGRARLMRDWIVAAINQHYSRPGSWVLICPSSKREKVEYGLELKIQLEYEDVEKTERNLQRTLFVLTKDFELLHSPLVYRAGLVTIQTRQEANIVNKDARLRDGARPMAAECGQTANQRSLRGPDTAVMAAIKFEFVLIPAISPGSDYHLCIDSPHKSLAGPVKTRLGPRHKVRSLMSWWQGRVADYAGAAVISFMTTQMAPDLVEICFDLETKKPDLDSGKQSRQTIHWALMGSGIGPGASQCIRRFKFFVSVCSHFAFHEVRS